MKSLTTFLRPALAATALVLAVAAVRAQNAEPPSDSGVRFKSGVELINVTATVSDASGRFVPGLRQDDFLVYEDDSRSRSRSSAPSACRSASASRSTRAAAWPARRSRQRGAALDRFLFELLDRAGRDCSSTGSATTPVLLQGWTTDRQLLPRALGRIDAERRHGDVRRRGRGGSAGAAGPEPQEGAGGHLGRQRHGQPRRTSASSSSRFARARCSSTRSASTARATPTVRRAAVQQLPPHADARSRSRSPACRAARGRWPPPPPIGGPGGGPRSTRRARRSRQRRRAARHDRRQRRPHRDRPRPARSRSGDGRHRRRIEQAVLPRLSRRPGKKDGRWHSIRVEVQNRAYRVRARRGYVAS